MKINKNLVFSLFIIAFGILSCKKENNIVTPVIHENVITMNSISDNYDSITTKVKKLGDEEARNKLIEHNLRLVAHIVKKYDNKKDDVDDLISIGTIGLIKGIDSYSYKHGTRLTTYCARCIENEILMYYRNNKKNSKKEVDS